MKFKKSLQSQLFCLLFIIFIVFMLIIVPVINGNLGSIIDREMYSTLEYAQKNYVMGIFNPEEIDSNRQCYHMHVYYSDTDGYHFRAEKPLDASLMEEVSYAIVDDIAKQIKNQEVVKNAKVSFRNGSLYYRILRVSETDHFFVVTFMNDEYSLSLAKNIANRIVYLQYGAFFFLAIGMAIWVTTLIRPLKQIRIYIDHIKEGKKGELNIQRHDEIGSVAQALVEMEEELQHQSKVREEMMHNISHDLKTPIALIESYAQSIKDDVYPYGDKESSIDIILENASRLEKKVQNLLYLNRLDYLKENVKDMHEMNMKVLLEKTVEQMASLRPEIHLQLDIQESYFIGEEEQWRIAIENLLQNAYRYVESTIQIHLDHQSLSIYNDGPCIPEDIIDTLFEPFVKGHQGQFGLGLHIVYKTVTMYHCTVTVENVLQGVCFKITKKEGL